MVATDGTIAITAGSGTGIRAINGTGSGGTQSQQVVTLADSLGALITAANPLTVVNEIVTFTATTGTLTTAGQTLTATNIANAGSVTVAMLSTAAAGGSVYAFEATLDGTNWYPIQGQRKDSFVPESSTTMPLSTLRAWDFTLTGETQFRVRTTAFVATQSTGVVILPSAQAVEQTPTVGLAPISGSAANPGVASSASSVTLFAANPAARFRRIANNSTATLYVREGGTAAAINSGGYSFAIPPNSTYEYPPGAVWVGAVTGIWSAANGFANCTELA